MPDKLFIFVEGDDDELFFNEIVEPALKTDCVIIKYARKQKQKIADSEKSPLQPLIKKPKGTRPRAFFLAFITPVSME